MFFFLSAVLRRDSIGRDALNEEQRDHPVFDSLYFDELLHVDLTILAIHVARAVSKSELCLLIDLSERTFVAVFTLIDLSFREIKLLDNLVSWIVIDNEENLVERLVED